MTPSQSLMLFIHIFYLNYTQDWSYNSEMWNKHKHQENEIKKGLDTNPSNSISAGYSTAKYDNFCIVMSNLSMSYTQLLKVVCKDEVTLKDSLKGGDCDMRTGQSSTKEDYLGLISGKGFFLNQQDQPVPVLKQKPRSQDRFLG